MKNIIPSIIICSAYYEPSYVITNEIFESGMFR